MTPLHKNRDPPTRTNLSFLGSLYDREDKHEGLRQWWVDRVPSVSEAGRN